MLDQMDDQEGAEYEAQCARFAALSAHLKGLRDEAIKARAASGIEQEWLEDEEYFQGIDDANRGDRMVKPTSPDGRVMIERKGGNKMPTRSTVFVNITKPFTIAAASKIADPLSRFTFGAKPTPIPDLIKKAEDKATKAFDEQGQPILKPMMDEAGNQVDQPHVVNGQPMVDQAGQPIMQPAMTQATVADVAKQEMHQAIESCEKAKTQIMDWLTEGGFKDEVATAINDKARIGTGVLKGPFPEYTRRRAVVKALEGIGMVIKEELAPKSRCISVWNLYPDGSCGESIHNGKYLFERDDINARQLQELAKIPEYNKEEIEKIIEEGPKSAFTGTHRRQRGDRPSDKETYEIWYFHGFLSRRDLMDAGYKFNEEAPEAEQKEYWQEDGEDSGLINDAAGGESGAGETEQIEPDDQPIQPMDGGAECECDENEQFPVIVVMVNDTVIKATLSPLDSGKFPYDVMVWQRRPGYWAGVGVPRQMRTEQDGVNAATRALMDNMGESARPHKIVNRGAMNPGPDRWTWYATDEFDGDIRKIMSFFNFPSNQAELMNTIQFWMNLAEKATGMPMLLQGSLSENTPQTYKGQQLLNNNASSVLRMTARSTGKAIEDHVNGYYEWLLLHGEDDSMKGDFKLEVAGMVEELIERDAQAQSLVQLLGASINPAFGLDPELVMAEMLKSQRFDAEKLKLSDEKKQQMQQAAQQGQPQDPRLQIAQMNAESKAALQQAELNAKAQLEQAKREFESQQADADRAMEQFLKNMDAQIANAEQRGEMDMSNNELKVSLARDAAKLRTQINLARQVRAPQVLAAPSEPPQRAPNGEAYQQ